jgi:hypothetical protein
LEINAIVKEALKMTGNVQDELALGARKRQIDLVLALTVKVGRSGFCALLRLRIWRPVKSPVKHLTART